MNHLSTISSSLVLGPKGRRSGPRKSHACISVDALFFHTPVFPTPKYKASKSNTRCTLGRNSQMFKRLDLVNWKMTLEVKDSNSPQVWMMVFGRSGFNSYVPNPLGSFSINRHTISTSLDLGKWSPILSKNTILKNQKNPKLSVDS